MHLWQEAVKNDYLMPIRAQMMDELLSDEASAACDQNAKWHRYEPIRPSRPRVDDAVVEMVPSCR